MSNIQQLVKKGLCGFNQKLMANLQKESFVVPTKRKIGSTGNRKRKGYTAKKSRIDRFVFYTKRIYTCVLYDHKPY